MNFPRNTISQLIPAGRWQSGRAHKCPAEPDANGFRVTSDTLFLFEVKPSPNVSSQMAGSIARFASLAPEMFDTLCAIADGKENPAEVARAFLMRRELQTPHGEDGMVAPIKR